MIHTKSLIRRLAYVPWLLAFGLMLGWAGEAVAQSIALSVDENRVREDGGVASIKVTATAKTGADGAGDDRVANADNPTFVILQTAATGLNDRFRIDLPTIMIAKGEKSGSVIVTLTPTDDDLLGGDAADDGPYTGDDEALAALTTQGPAGATDDFVIRIEGVVGAGQGNVTPVNILLIDDDKQSAGISLSYGGAKIAQDGEPTNVTVTATLNGATLFRSLEFDLLVDQTNPATGIAVRDKDYRASVVPIIIKAGSSEGTAQIEITPLDVSSGSIALTSTDVSTETGTQVYGIVEYTHPIDADGDGTEGETLDVAVDETTNSVDFDRDGAFDNTAFVGAREGGKYDQRIELLLTSVGFIVIDPTPTVAPEGVTASPASVREDAGTGVVIDLAVTLLNPLSEPERVSFTIREPTEPGSNPAKRDVDYEATFSDLTIDKDGKTGDATLTIDIVDNDRVDLPKTFIVVATVGGEEKTGTITITDDETPTDLITLSVDEAEVTAGTSETIMVTATINGNQFEDDVDITLVLAPKGKAFGDVTADAQRDIDFGATLRSLSISAGDIQGSIGIEIDALKGGDKKIFLEALEDPVEGVAVKEVLITLKDAPEGEDPADPGELAFAADIKDSVYDFVVGEEKEQPLPDVTGGAEGDKTYATSALPAGLSFDVEELEISGAPTAAGETTVIYTVIDSEGASVAVPFTIEVAAEPPPTVDVESVSLTQKSIRENGEATSISVTATLEAPAPVAAVVSFTIGNATGDAALDKAAIRDVDYTASLLGSVAIEAGATQATSTLILTPLNNDEEDGNRSFGVHASAPDGKSAAASLTIADDETDSRSISLSADPHTVSEDAGVLVIVVTATLDGKVLPDDAVVTVKIDPNSQATRDVDFGAVFNPLLTIDKGAVSGSIEMAFEPTSDAVDEGNETITLIGEIEGLLDGTGTIVIADVAMMDEEEMMDPLAFAEGAMIDDIGVTAGSPLGATELPAASGGDGDITYSVEGLPEGLSFDAETRMLSGSTDVEGAAEVTYTATAGEESVSLTFTITVNPPLTFGDLFGLFLNGGAGKANPADSHVDEDGVLQIVVGQPYNLTLPPVEGGTPPYSYELIGLPAGLSFDTATRTVSGTATELADTFAITYRVTDGSGASRSLPFLAAVVAPPLDAPDALVAADYKGADGAGDQGGFVLLTWDLSEHHDGIDGYRIFRELPVLGNEMVPWAMVDAVPGVSIGRAIVATLDNVATNWGIAAERGGQTTHGAAKAVFVNAENAYELMAETMAASVEAAQAGDAPVFAALLPEALEFAQGVAPNLNLVEGVLSSAVTVTEEPARAIDNIAPLAVPSFGVLDAPNDQGSRIILTWTLSPSDLLLQDVVAGVVGPAQAEPVVGVYGYSIYRRAASEDEFARIAQVDAGVTSFVDETALNGVRYTYQVRPYDLDNETGSDLEQTAMAVRNLAVDSEGRTLFGLFGADNSIGFDDFFIFADNFGLTAEDTGFDPAFDLAPNAMIDFDDFFVLADNFGRSTAAAGKIVPMLAGLNADARMYLDARTAMPVVGEDFVLDVRLADFAAIKGYGLQVQYDASQLEFVEVLTDQPLGGGEFATPQVLSNAAGVLAVAALGDVVSEGEVALSLVFRAPTEIENTLIEITDNQTYDSEFGFNSLALPAPVQLQTRPEVFSLANNYPNPFNPATTIKYALPQAADVELTVYNVVGQPIRTLVAEHQNAGRYVVEWDATNDNGHRLASGMYFYRLEAGGEFLEIKKMLLLK